VTLKLLLRALAAAGKLAELIATLEQRLPDESRDAEIWCMLGYAHNSLGQDASAVAAFTQALRLDPGRGDAHCGLGYAFLRQGNYAQGFLHHEHRQGTGGIVNRLGVPSWQGESLASKHLLVWTEQAMGDMIQFARYVPLASRLAESVTFKVPKVLIRVFSSNREMGRLTSEHPGFGAADVQALVMSLPHRLGIGNDVSCATVPYLWPEAELVQRWKARLPQGRLIALSWQGNPAFAGEPWRSIPLERLAPVVAHHKRVFRFLSLQKNHGREQLESSGFGRDIIDLGDEIDNDGDAFVDSLAILASVELLLTTDTSLAHLAGAANVPTWLMLPFACDWRWGNGGSSTNWYPNTCLFRQRSPGDWNSVISDVLAALSQRH
jgi:tetratricopeptide (TPR) repeat protein